MADNRNTNILRITYGYGFTEIPLPLMMVYIAIGEIIGCYILGEILGGVLLRYRSVMFRGEGID